METEGFASYAWLLRGATVSIPGWLDLQEGRLRFLTPEAIVFDASLPDVSGVTFPWYYFGGGVKLLAAGVPFRLSFVKPNGVDYVAARALAAFAQPEALLLAAMKIGDVNDGRAVGKEWRRLLGTPTASS
jgi:hypothetical protein